MMNVAIIGTGNIANCMAEAVTGLDESICAYAVASRTLESAKKFAEKWGFQKFYGSYEELVLDPKVDLVYIATPHAMHYQNAKLCIEHGKNVLVEKAFTANEKQAKELITLAKKKKVLLTEAIWTRYMPSRNTVEELLSQKIIGEPQRIEAEFSVELSHIERMTNPALAGGALLDLGMYTLTFTSMFFGDDIIKMESNCEKYETGVDATDNITLTYRDGKIANLRTSMVTGPKNYGKIYGTKGYIEVKDLNNFSKIDIYNEENECVKTLYPPKQINGYEYEVLACKEAIEADELECEQMPHEETLTIMRWMDQLRKSWGIIYPFE